MFVVDFFLYIFFKRIMIQAVMPAVTLVEFLGF